MAQIKNEAAYRVALQRIDELLPLVHDNTPTDDKHYLELDMISDMVEEYESVHYPIQAPSMAEMLGISCARISEIISGKGEPSLRTGREMCRKLNIDPSVVLGL